MILPEHSTPLELVVGARSRLLLGGEVASRLPASQLASLGSRQLALLRQEFLWRGTLVTQDRLAAAIGLCVRFARRSSKLLPSADDLAQDFDKRFLSEIETENGLTEQIEQLFRGYDTEPTAWEGLARSCIRAADRSLLRVGLVACANPAMACEATKEFPMASPLSAEDQLDEIARFATSRAHITLRKSLGINLTA